MSHVCTIDLEIKDLDSLAAACKELGLEMVRGQQTYRWYGRSVGDYPLPQGFAEQDLGKCQHAIRIPGDSRAYEIGVTERRDGRPGYTLLWDFFAGGYGMEAKVGSDGDRLKQEYAAAVSAKIYRRQGYRITRTMKEGRVILTATK